MKLFKKLHFGDCEEKIEILTRSLDMALKQNIEFSREIVDLVCKLRMMTLNKHITCEECPEKKEIESLINKVLE